MPLARERKSRAVAAYSHIFAVTKSHTYIRKKKKIVSLLRNAVAVARESGAMSVPQIKSAIKHTAFA